MRFSSYECMSHEDMSITNPVGPPWEPESAPSAHQLIEIHQPSPSASSSHQLISHGALDLVGITCIGPHGDAQLDELSLP